MYVVKLTIGLILFATIGFVTACYFSPYFLLKTASALVKLELGDVPEITNTALRKLIDLSDSDLPIKIVLLDVRTQQEKQISMIPGAVDHEYFEQHQDDYKHQKIIVYCTIGYRSGFYTHTLLEKGFDAYNLSEGILGWVHVKGLLLDSNKEPTKQVHVYSRPWDLAVKDYIAIY